MRKTITSRKSIFIGSSVEGLAHARNVAAFLEQTKMAKAVLWTNVFRSGDITMARIERLASEVDAAIFIATPDDVSELRGKRVQTPRANVIFEYGYLVARLGRSRVALCVYDNTVLPSDFNGLTHVVMGSHKDTKDINHTAKKILGDWTEGLRSVQEGISTSSLLHGYSGEWKLKATFTRWRGRKISHPDSVYYAADLVLHVPFEDEGLHQSGCGSANGEITVDLKSKRQYAAFSRSDRIITVQIGTDGSIDLFGEVKSRQVITLRNIKTPEDGFEAVLQITRNFEIKTMTTKVKGVLEGIYTTSAMDNIISQAKVRLQRSKV